MVNDERDSHGLQAKFFKMRKPRRGFFKALTLTDQPDHCAEVYGQQRDELTRGYRTWSFGDLVAYLCNESVHVNSFGLSKAINPEDGLYIMRGVPRHVKHNHSIGCHKINPQATGLGRDEKQTSAERNQKQVKG